MKMFIASDHAGVEVKKEVVDYLNSNGIEVEELDIPNHETDDYPDFAFALGKQVVDNNALGILICGNGIGMSIAANKVKGIRAAVVHDMFTAEMCKRHNNANILSMGGRVVSPELAKEMTKKWLETEFEGGRHTNRLNKVSAIEEKYFK